MMTLRITNNSNLKYTNKNKGSPNFWDRRKKKITENSTPKSSVTKHWNKATKCKVAESVLNLIIRPGSQAEHKKTSTHITLHSKRWALLSAAPSIVQAVIL